jgi:hypothetical protein
MSAPGISSQEAQIAGRLTHLHGVSMQLCYALAQQLNETSGLVPNEPMGDIADFDSEFGVLGHEVLGDPLKAAHEMTTAYALSAGELLWAVAALMASSNGLVVAPGAMTRSVAVHSARVFRLSDPFLSPLDRCNLFLHFVKSGWMPDTEGRKGLMRDIEIWISRHGLGKPKDIVQEERLVASMFDEEVNRINRSKERGNRKKSILIDDNFYKRLSGLVHGDPTTLLIALIASNEYPLVNRLHVLLDSIVGLVTAYKAGNRLNDLRGGAIERYDEIYYALVDLTRGFREVRADVETIYKIRLRSW